MNWFKKILSKEKKDLSTPIDKTRSSILDRLNHIFLKKSQIDDQTLEKLEEALISCDIGIETSLKIIENLKKRIKKEKYSDISELQKIFYQEVLSLISSKNKTSQKETLNFHKPYVIMVVGINGVGKTTTIGKLAYKFNEKKLKVLLGAADTFRAAATEQLNSWAERTNVPIVKQKIGSDPASVAFDTLQSAKSKEIDVVLIDTAGRLHNKSHLMEELSRIKRVMHKVIPGAPHEVMLVLDGSTGQNAFEQVRQLSAATSLNSLAITKLDGTAKGGVIIGIVDQFDIPIKYIGVGEKINDLKEFEAKEFLNYIFKDSIFTT